MIKKEEIKEPYSTVNNVFEEQKRKNRVRTYIHKRGRHNKKGDKQDE